MELPEFLSLQGESLIYNKDDGSIFEFFVPEVFFGNTKSNIAEVYGEYVSFIGICNWAIIDKNGKMKVYKAFNFPTMVLTKPYEIEKIKDFSFDTEDPSDYRILKFAKGDEVVSQIRVPELIDNVEMFFKLSVTTAKIPNTIAYDDIWKLFVENARLNGFSYNLNIQLFCILIRLLCRNRDNVSEPFCFTDMKDMYNYKHIPITEVINYISPYTAITGSSSSSNTFDSHLRSAILMSDMPEKDIPKSPLEKVIMQ